MAGKRPALMHGETWAEIRITLNVFLQDGRLDTPAFQLPVYRVLDNSSHICVSSSKWRSLQAS